MQLQPNTTRFIEELQAHFGRKLTFPGEVGILLEQASNRKLDDVYRDVIFQAKFVTRTREVMGRIGREGEGFDKLSTEFQNSVEKSSSLLKTIVKESPGDIKQHFVGKFFGLDQTSFSSLLSLLEDLNWVKNYELDGFALPLAKSLSRSSYQDPSAPNTEGGTSGSRSEDLRRMRNGSVLGIVLMMFLFLVDAPVTSIGWILSLIVVLLLLYIALASHKLAKQVL